MDTKELLKITLGLNDESTYKSINLSEIHSLLICGGTPEIRKAFLDNIGSERSFIYTDSAQEEMLFMEETCQQARNK